MSEFVTENWKYLLAALLLHIALGVMLTISIHSTTNAVNPFQSAIQGVIVDHSAERIKRERAEQQRLAKEKADTEAAAAAKAKAEEQAEQKAADQKAAEQKAVEQKLALQKIAAQKILEHQQQIAAQEKQRAASQSQKQIAAQEAKRVADIKQKQAEKQRNEQAARDRVQRESELKQQMADEEGRMQAMKSGAADQYYAMIKDRILRNWNKPDSARPGIVCEVAVTQAPGGTVLSAVVGKCNGDQAVRESIQTAAFRASPLPMPSDIRLFQRTFTLLVDPKDEP